MSRAARGEDELRHPIEPCEYPLACLPAPRSCPRDKEDAVLAQLLARADATLEEHGDRWREATGRAVSNSTMCRAQRRVGCTRTKSRS